jgi:hypothetical protein
VNRREAGNANRRERRSFAKCRRAARGAGRPATGLRGFRRIASARCFSASLGAGLRGNDDRCGLRI